MKSTRKATFRDSIAAEKVLKKVVKRSDKPKVELRGIQVHLGLSDETPAYTARLLVDGVHFADVRNDGHGGCDLVDAPKGEEKDFRDRLEALEAMIAETYPETDMSQYKMDPMKESLEGVCHGLVWLHVDQRNFRSQLSRNLMALDDGKIWAWTKRGHDLDVMRGGIKAKRPDATFLNDLPFDEAFQIVQDNS